MWTLSKPGRNPENCHIAVCIKVRRGSEEFESKILILLCAIPPCIISLCAISLCAKTLCEKKFRCDVYDGRETEPLYR